MNSIMVKKVGKGVNFNFVNLVFEGERLLLCCWGTLNCGFESFLVLVE